MIAILLCYTNKQHMEDFNIVMVILCDFQKRKFQLRLPHPGEELISKINKIENAIYRFKTKLDAALARSRIQARVQSLDFLLPEKIRQNGIVGENMEVCCWLNQNKAK